MAQVSIRQGDKMNKDMEEQIKEEQMLEQFWAEHGENLHVDPAEIDFDVEFPMEQSQDSSVLVSKSSSR